MMVQKFRGGAMGQTRARAFYGNESACVVVGVLVLNLPQKSSFGIGGGGGADGGV